MEGPTGFREGHRRTSKGDSRHGHLDVIGDLVWSGADLQHLGEEEALGGWPPKDFILTIMACDFAEHCIEQPLLTDVQYDSLRAQGCGRR